jgi:hypothetical protein
MTIVAIPPHSVIALLEHTRAQQVQARDEPAVNGDIHRGHTVNDPPKSGQCSSPSSSLLECGGPVEEVLELVVLDHGVPRAALGEHDRKNGRE